MVNVFPAVDETTSPRCILIEYTQLLGYGYTY